MSRMGFFDVENRYAALDARHDPLVKINALVPCERSAVAVPIQRNSRDDNAQIRQGETPRAWADKQCCSLNEREPANLPAGSVRGRPHGRRSPSCPTSLVFK